MCGRFSLAVEGDVLARLFQVPLPEAHRPRFNVAPTQDVAAVRSAGCGPGRELVFLRWGLIPAWSREGPQGPLLINARAETVSGKPSFRDAFRERRCLIPADGFFEWKREGNARVPYWFFPLSGPLFAFAGLWECWQGPGSERVESCTILTTEANERVRPLHPRMPVILPPERQDRWLDPGVRDPALLGGLLAPCPAAEMGCRQVSARVNQVRNDDSGVLLPVRPPAPPGKGEANPGFLGKGRIPPIP